MSSYHTMIIISAGDKINLLNKALFISYLNMFDLIFIDISTSNHSPPLLVLLSLRSDIFMHDNKTESCVNINGALGGKKPLHGNVSISNRSRVRYFKYL